MTKYQARIPNVTETNAPDEFDTSLYQIPPDNFVVSKNFDGSPLSYYGDPKWDRNPYAPTGIEKTNVLNFCSFGEEERGNTPNRISLMNEMRWCMFMLIYFRRGASLSNATAYKYLTGLKAAAAEAEKRSIRICDIITDIHLLRQLPESSVGTVLSLTKLIRFLGPDIVGFECPDREDVQDIQKKVNAYANKNKQHPPIPSRIYSNIITAISNEVGAFNDIIDSIISIYETLASSPFVGRTKAYQRDPRRQIDSNQEFSDIQMSDLLRQYGLTDIWRSRGYMENARGIIGALSEAQLFCALQIQLFTGAREKEIKTLPYNCLESVIRGDDPRHHHIVVGYTTKLAKGKRKQAKWVTSERGRDAIMLAQRIAICLYKVAGIEISKSQEPGVGSKLFVSPARALYDGKIRNALADQKNKKRFTALIPTILEEDIDELRNIDPARAWTTEPEYAIGLQWQFTSHQLRRSLALYCQAYGISLPTLRRQLQHLTDEMATFYAKGSSWAKNWLDENAADFVEEFHEAQPVSEYLAYASHVFNADPDDMIGGHSAFINVRMRDENGVVVMNRPEMIRLFGEGRMGYRSTPLGVCVNTNPCQHTPINVLNTECLVNNCAHLMGSEKKVQRIIFVKEVALTQYELIDPEMSECRIERAEIGVLKDALKKINENFGSIRR